LTSNPADSPGKIDLPDGRLDEIKPMAETPCGSASDKSLTHQLLAQLVQSLVFVKNESGEMPSEDLYNHPVLMALTLARKIRNEFDLHAAEGEESVANALAPFFSQAKDNPEKFGILLNLVVFEVGYCPLFIAAVLEKSIWPTEKMKEEELRVHLGSLIARSYLSVQSHAFILSSDFKTGRLVVMTEEIFGRRDFVKFPETISPL
jgi:hypothetical protein